MRISDWSSDVCSSDLWILSIPWKKRTKVKRDIKHAQEILDADHYGLEKVKERILEYLAVQQRMKKVKGPILCLVGPPGVGKTSLGKSIARATGRHFVRMRSEERRVGKECVRPCRSRSSP